MAAIQTPPAYALGAEPAGAALDGRRAEGERVSAKISGQLRIALPVINVLEAAVTYAFVAYIVPLPGHNVPARAREGALIASIVLVGMGWLACDRWGTWTMRPVKSWLEAGRDPTAPERRRTLRLPMLEAGQVLALWAVAGLGSFAFDLASGGSITAAVLVGVMVVFGGLVASALTYLVTERIVRPATALALAAEPPTRPVVPGIGVRIYLAWEFGTAVAVGGAVVAAIAYLAGSGMSADRMAATVIFLGVFALIVGAGTLLFALRSVADPVKAMRVAMRRVEAGETDITVEVDDGSEVGLLQAGFNRMVAGLRERDRVRDLFGRHVGEEVARSALGSKREMGGELRDAAILFVDVVGSTAFASRRDPREVVETLNRFFEIVVEVVTMHGGWINKFEGDAALCVFGAPTEHPDAAGAALGAARELARRLATELDGLGAAIGLSAGEVVAGNVGAAERYEYTVIGDPVNEAARLTELAKRRPSQVLASESIVRRAAQREAGRWEFGEPVVLRGRSTATRIATPA
ncbi:MAG TPA: adenylate/guanylate cyclase domain-containing protein [Solirubrobacteraceae bacterium]